MFSSGQIAHPEVASGVATVRKRLAEYRTEEHFTLTEADLPPRYRLVYADNDGIGFAVTDERDADGDPAALSVLWDDNEIVDYAPSYLKLCAEAVLGAAFDSWYTLAVSRPAGGDLFAAEQRPPTPFPTLAPRAFQLSPTLWLDADPDMTYVLLHATSFENLVRWLHAQDLGSLRIPLLPGDVISRVRPLRIPDGIKFDLRSGDSSDAPPLRAGWIAGIAVIVQQRGEVLEIAVNPRHRTALESLLDAGGA
jgi:hypothetical protein